MSSVIGRIVLFRSFVPFATGLRMIPTSSGSIHEQVRFPAIIDGADKVPDEGNMVRLHRLPQELHVRIVGSAVSFSIIALDARGDKVLPRVFA